MQFNKARLVYPVIFGLAAIYYTLPLLINLDHWGVRDWDLFLTIAGAPAASILDYAQFPFWNPYLGGGNILFHHPEVGVLTPFFLLYLLFGPVVGLKLQVLLGYFIGLYGSHRLAQQLGISNLSAVMVAFAYFGSVHFALHFAEGHMPFTHFCFLPWFIVMILGAGKDSRRLIWASLALALMILGNGAAIPLLYTLLFSGLLCVMFSLSERTAQYLKSLVIAVAGGMGLSAVKFIPMVIYLAQNRWPGTSDESIPLAGLWSIFFGIKHSLFTQNFPGQFWSWHEYGAYVSPLLILLAGAALIFRFRRYWIWLVLATFFLLLGMGNFGPLSPWAILSQFPGFASARCTGRSFQMVILSVAVLGGFGFDYLAGRFRSLGRERLVRFLLYPVVGIVVATNLALAWPIMSSAVGEAPERVSRNEVFEHVIDEKPQAFRNFLANRGSLISPWLSAYHPSRALVVGNNQVLPEYLLSGQAEVISRDYTPNRISYRLNGNQPGEIVVGMGYDPGWQSSDGRKLFERSGLIAFRFDRGKQAVELSYRSPFVTTGAVVSLLSLAGLCWMWRKRSPAKA